MRFKWNAWMVLSVHQINLPYSCRVEVTFSDEFMERHTGGLTIEMAQKWLKENDWMGFDPCGYGAWNKEVDGNVFSYLRNNSC
jgi:hypothetical protein